MPPYFNFTLHSGPGEYHGFVWFYFINETMCSRFLNLRYPRDYQHGCRGQHSGLLHLLWLVFPGGAFFSSRDRSQLQNPVDRGWNALAY